MSKESKTYIDGSGKLHDRYKPTLEGKAHQLHIQPDKDGVITLEDAIAKRYLEIMQRHGWIKLQIHYTDEDDKSLVTGILVDKKELVKALKIVDEMTDLKSS